MHCGNVTKGAVFNQWFGAGMEARGENDVGDGENISKCSKVAP